MALVGVAVAVVAGVATVVLVAVRVIRGDVRLLRLALLAGPLLPVVGVLLGLGEDLAHRAPVAHARGGRALALAVDAHRVLAARHLEDLGGAREAHGARAPLRQQVHHDAATSDEVAAARQRADRRDAAGDGALDGGILRPERVLGPQPRGDRVGQLVAVVVPLGVRHRVDAHVRVRVDNPGRDELAVAVDDRRSPPSAASARRPRPRRRCDRPRAGRSPDRSGAPSRSAPSRAG